MKNDDPVFRQVVRYAITYIVVVLIIILFFFLLVKVGGVQWDTKGKHQGAVHPFRRRRVHETSVPQSVGYVARGVRGPMR